MNIEWSYMTGHFSQVEEELCERLDALSKRHRRIYVGVTYDPITRAQDHEREGRSYFVILWRTTSRKRIAQAERTLIAQLGEKEKTLIRRLIRELIPRRGKSDNKGSGGEGIRDKSEYFLYVAS